MGSRGACADGQDSVQKKHSLTGPFLEVGVSAHLDAKV